MLLVSHAPRLLLNASNIHVKFSRGPRRSIMVFYLCRSSSLSRLEVVGRRGMIRYRDEESDPIACGFEGIKSWHMTALRESLVSILVFELRKIRDGVKYSHSRHWSTTIGTPFTYVERPIRIRTADKEVPLQMWVGMSW